MGMGIWSMHFIGMLAYSVEIPLRYSVVKTILSLVIAVVTSGFALAIASRPKLSFARLTFGSIVMGAGICGMHYSGMGAIQIVPMITYQPMLVLASIGIAVGASFAALWLAFKLRNDGSKYVSLARAGAALVMGLAISGMHYTAMAASRLAVGAYCFGGAALDNNWLAVTIGLVAIGVLALTLITAVYDAHLMSQRRQEDERRRELQFQLRDASREAGMAEVATGVLHSVGNVLNSLGVSASLVQSTLRNSRVANIQRVASMLQEQGAQLGQFLLEDERGRQLPVYLTQLGENLAAENQGLQAEAAAIAAHVGHIRTIVAAQQAHARRGGVIEAVDVAELLDNAAALHFADMPDVSIRREYETLETVTLDRHKLIQILGNLMSNARFALKEQSEGRRQLWLQLRRHDDDKVELAVRDSGVGIEPDVLSRLFEFGFTTKKDGHGFGLHTSAILAKELGGGLEAFSPGAGKGARFVLRLAAAAESLRKQA
jgi:NO-binding membrane sensor protein with MHYT domain/two-component sensor histidine kinase